MRSSRRDVRTLRTAPPRELFISDLDRVIGGNNAPIENDSPISTPNDNEGPQPPSGGGWGTEI